MTLGDRAGLGALGDMADDTGDTSGLVALGTR